MALALFAFGADFPWRDQTHSLGRFADNCNGARPAVVPASVARWADPHFQLGPVFSARAGTAGFQGAPDALRMAMIEGGTLAPLITWTRFELAIPELPG